VCSTQGGTVMHRHSEETRMQQALGKPRHTGPSAMGAVSFMHGKKTLK
jgi:hypothetical protein